MGRREGEREAEGRESESRGRGDKGSERREEEEKRKKRRRGKRRREATLNKLLRFPCVLFAHFLVKHG